MKEIEFRDQKFCVTCSLMLLPEELEAHKKHKIRSGINKKLIQKPTKLLAPAEIDKKNAVRDIYYITVYKKRFYNV